ncbi:hypothetical protein PsorP6_002703 [Peronosclerospora sorghi]|uniref:Uncharacterized protein n=1 Tax=Peronosclerospora sorghi TaxID=230839 RepID=A0ACC0WUC9_9STRA|nr:hypothetical protein PsorP6_002703 [Peronosclerospora sorghi]
MLDNTWIKNANQIYDNGIYDLPAETVQRASLTLKSIHDIHCSDSFATGVLRVCYRVTNYILKEYFQYTAGFLVNKSGDTFHTTTTSKTTNSWLRDTLNVVAKNLAMTLRSTFSQPFTAFSTTRHIARFSCLLAL